MPHPRLGEVLIRPEVVRTIAPDIYSTLPANSRRQMYDGRASAYDRVVGSGIYNRVVWGNSPADYRAFAEDAVGEDSQTWLMDAGGGSLLFTADAFARTARPILILDQSLSMLAIARQRLIDRAGHFPENVVLLQGDLLDLTAFRPSSFGTILSLGVLHHIDRAGAMLATLSKLLTPSGRMHFTSLIISGRWSDMYLRALYRSGGFANPRNEAAVRALFEANRRGHTSIRVKGSMLYVMA